MSRPRYNLANLIPRNLYATQVLHFLVDLRSELNDLPPSEFDRSKLDALSREIADRHAVAAADLRYMLRVVFELPGTVREPFASLESLGQEYCLRGIEGAILMLTDVARQ
jgi:hypothetical protein